MAGEVSSLMKKYVDIKKNDTVMYHRIRQRIAIWDSLGKMNHRCRYKERAKK